MDIILMIILLLKIGRIAEAKGLQPTKWRIRFALLWIGLELLGFLVGTMMFGSDNFISCMLLAYAFALGAYFFMKNQLEKLPDSFNEDEFGR